MNKMIRQNNREPKEYENSTLGFTSTMTAVAASKSRKVILQRERPFICEISRISFNEFSPADWNV